jgi:hypothetical protein
MAPAGYGSNHGQISSILLIRLPPNICGSRVFMGAELYISSPKQSLLQVSKIKSKTRSYRVLYSATALLLPALRAMFP